jgi:Domain of unknown function (DUF4430)
VRGAEGRRLTGRRPRPVAAALALFAGAVALAGCGLGPGSSIGDVGLRITHDYGAERVSEQRVGDLTESDTVMRVLDRSAQITTRYGGGFVQSIDGVEGSHGGGSLRDWFFYVNGVESPIGAADYSLHGGDQVWWDYRDWSAAMQVPAVIGAWPEPFRHGYEGERHPSVVRCEAAGTACAVARAAVRRAAGDAAAKGDPIEVLVGPWSRVRADPAAAQIEQGPQYSGVFAGFRGSGSGLGLVGLGADGKPARSFGPRAGLVAATRRYGAEPVWVVTGVRQAGVRAAAAALTPAALRYHYAVAAEGRKITPLPVP